MLPKPLLAASFEPLVLALLGRGETMDVAFVASNPGDWAFHCHIIEHQKTGLAGFIRVA